MSLERTIKTNKSNNAELSQVHNWAGLSAQLFVLLVLLVRSNGIYLYIFFFFLYVILSAKQKTIIVFCIQYNELIGFWLIFYWKSYDFIILFANTLRIFSFCLHYHEIITIFDSFHQKQISSVYRIQKPWKYLIFAYSTMK